jgi:hypothetical protein
VAYVEKEGKRGFFRKQKLCTQIGQKWPQYKGLSPTPLAILDLRLKNVLRKVEESSLILKGETIYPITKIT